MGPRRKQRGCEDRGRRVKTTGSEPGMHELKIRLWRRVHGWLFEWSSDPGPLVAAKGQRRVRECTHAPCEYMYSATQ